MFVKSLVSLFGLFSVISDAETKYVIDLQTEDSLSLHETPATIADALVMCDMEGGKLADLDDNQIRAQVINLLFTINKSVDEIFTRQEAPDNDYSNSPGDSDIGPFRQYIFNPLSSTTCKVCNMTNGLSRNVTCDHKLPFICYKEQAPIRCGVEYTYEERSNSCYKFHMDVQTWNKAYVSCMAEGGYLAIINSQTELEVVRAMLARYPVDMLMAEPYNAFIGFRDCLDGDSWKTVEGQSLEEAGYSTWSAGQPNGMTLNLQQHCGAITRTNEFNDMQCDIPIHYICEKTPYNENPFNYR